MSDSTFWVHPYAMPKPCMYKVVERDEITRRATGGSHWKEGDLYGIFHSGDAEEAHPVAVVCDKQTGIMIELGPTDVRLVR